MQKSRNSSVLSSANLLVDLNSPQKLFTCRILFIHFMCTKSLKSLALRKLNSLFVSRSLKINMAFDINLLVTTICLKIKVVRNILEDSYYQINNHIYMCLEIMKNFARQRNRLSIDRM